MLEFEIRDLFGTREERTRGLMNVPWYPEGCCALFVFDEPQQMKFHTMNCKFDIIVVFVDENNCIDSWHYMKPETGYYTSNGKCKYAVEFLGDRTGLNEISKARIMKILGDKILFA